MLCSFYVVLFKFLAVILNIYRAQGELCSNAEEEACLLAGRFCSNSQCGPCRNGYIEFNDELCYDANNAQDIVLEHLEKCNPNNDPACKKKLESIRAQLADELTKSYHTKEIDSSSLKLTKPTIKTTNEQKNILSKLEKETKVNKPVLEKDKKADLSKGDDVGMDSLEMLNESETNALSKKSPVDNNSNDDGEDEEMPDVYFLIIIIACTLSGIAGIALSGYCWYKLHNSDEKVSKSDYMPGVRNSNGKKSPPAKNGDRKLDYKAEMYHYVHTKNQIAAMENAKSDHLSSDPLSHDEEDDVEDYTVYECPGLAPTGDMTVVNPLFSDQEVAGSDECRTQSNHSSPSTPARSYHSPSR